MITTPYMSDGGEIVARKGDSLLMSLIYNSACGEPIDLTGCKASFQAAEAAGGTPFIDASTEGASPEITLGGAAGTIELNVTAANMSNITPNSGVYGLKIVFEDGVVTTIIAGAIKLLPSLADNPT